MIALFRRSNAYLWTVPDRSCIASVLVSWLLVPVPSQVKSWMRSVLRATTYRSSASASMCAIRAVQRWSELSRETQREMEMCCSLCHSCALGCRCTSQEESEYHCPQCQQTMILEYFMRWIVQDSTASTSILVCGKEAVRLTSHDTAPDVLV